MFEIPQLSQVLRVRCLGHFFLICIKNMIIIAPQIAGEGVSALVFRILVFELMFLSFVQGLVIFDWVEFLVSHNATSGTVLHGH